MDGQREKIELSRDLSHSLDSLLEKKATLDEDQLVEYLDSDEELANLPLKIRERIFQAVKAHQDRLAGKTPEAVAEKPEMPGRDPEKFFNEVFEWLISNRGYGSPGGWIWTISRDHKLVNMKFNEYLDPRFVDKILPSIKYDVTDSGSGIDNLKDIIGSKKIISLSVNGSWFLEILP